MRGLGNVGVYGRGVSEILRTCGGDANVNTTVRVAAVIALGRGPCPMQVSGWLPVSLCRYLPCIECDIMHMKVGDLMALDLHTYIYNWGI